MTAPRTSAKPGTVTDEAGRLYELSEPLGTGGQGSVFLCKGEKLAVKILQAPGAEARERVRMQLAFVRRLPLAELHVAKPVAVLADPLVGYVMDFMSGMISLTGLCSPPPSGVTAWHLRGGSLRRRLRILGNLADRLHLLHSRGLVYGDPSPANVFVSAAQDAAEVWLIDSDNICYTSSPRTSTYFTPRYGAPELVRGRSGYSTLSDAYAFAVIAYEMLTLTHPLIGRAVTAGAPDEELAALRGERPWVESAEDDSNGSEFGIRPSSKVLSARLKGLCEETFGAGLNNPTIRPGLRAWRDVMHWAEAATLVCGSCGGSLYRSEVKCPWCNAGRPAHALVTLVAVLPDLRLFRDEVSDTFGVPKDGLAKNETHAVGQLAVTNGEERGLSDFHLTGGAPATSRVTVAFTDGVASLTNIACEDMHVAYEGKWRALKKGGKALVQVKVGQGVIAARWGNPGARHIALKLTSLAGAQ